MKDVLVAVVGVCASGKTTLVHGLRAHGVSARQVLQEHSYVPAMWQRITRPDYLVYLDAALETIRCRRSDPEYPGWLLEEQVRRLRHARTHCNVYVRTDELTAEAVLERVLDALGGVPF